MKEKYISFYKSRGKWQFRYKTIRIFFDSKDEAIIERDSTLAREASVRDALLASAEMRDYKRAKALAGGVPLESIVRDWLKMVGGRDAPSIGDALLKWRERCEKKRLSARTLETYRAVANRVEEAFAGKRLADLNEKLLVDWYYTLGGSARSRRSLLTNTVSFLNFCAESSWIEKAPRIRRSQLEREVLSGVEVFSVDEVFEILETVKRLSPEYFPNLALRAFVGLRTAEAARMRWEYIDFKSRRIVVPAEICKTRDSWVLQSPNLPPKIFRVLEPFRKRNGNIPVIKNGSWERLVDALPFGWKHNGLRHTFCTMHVALFGDASRTATLLKHRGLNMLFKHYCGQLVSSEDAKKYFE